MTTRHDAAASERETLAAYEELQRERARERQELVLHTEGERREAMRLASDEWGWFAHDLVLATLPHKDPGSDVTHWQRVNGNFSLHIQADQQIGLPFGTYPRLLTAWMATEGVRTKSRELYLGRSLRDFMSRLGLGDSGTGAKRFYNQMGRFFGSTFRATYRDGNDTENRRMLPVDSDALFFDPLHPRQRSLWESRIVLSERFYESLVKRPVMVDMRTMHALSRSPMAMDLYVWLTSRVFYLDKPVTVPWAGTNSLKAQLGSEYKRLDHFRHYVGVALASVKREYPKLNAHVTADGLRLEPSPPHVRLVAGKAVATGR